MHVYYHDFKKVFVWILISHVLLTLLAYFGLPDFRFQRRPDLTIELSVMAPSSGGQDRQSLSAPTTAISKQEKRLAQDKDGTLPKQAASNAVNEPQSSAGGPASAATVDADYKAAYLKNPKPPYPPMAVKMRLEGKVTLLVEVLPDGRAGRVGLESSSGHELLDQSALETVKKWQFAPARKDGVIISQVVRIPITFNLKSR